MIARIKYYYWSIVVAVLKFLIQLTVGVVLLTSCHSKSKPAPAPTVIYADTTRTILVHRADASSGAITIIHERNQKTVATYEKSVAQFDSIRLTLP